MLWGFKLPFGAVFVSFWSMSYFAFFAFPLVGLSAAWAKMPAQESLVILLPSGEKRREVFSDISELPPDLVREAPSPWMSVLSFFFPPAGLVLWLAWYRSFPGKSRSAGEGAAAGAIVSGIAGSLFLVLTVMIRPI